MAARTYFKFLCRIAALTAIALLGAASAAPAAPRTVSSEDDVYPPRALREREMRYVRRHYDKHEHRIPMRDGVHLFTAIYTPKDTSRKYPILMLRTPYSLSVYGADEYPQYPWYLGPPLAFAEAGYIFVYQDVRGCFMSEGDFVNVRPHIPDKRTAREIDESTDTYDTVEFLLANVPNHNGRVGLWGISYPGFYAAAGMIDAHPAITAVSPQAPVADWFFDDCHQHGTLSLALTFNFFAIFGRPRTGLTTMWGRPFDHGTPDGYQFFLELGPLKNVNARYFHGEVRFWNELVRHPNYDSFWQDRNILPHLRNVAPAVMTVGGWFDAEDLYGTLKTYRAIEQQNPHVFNILVMGPWAHGGWHRSRGDRLGPIDFDSHTSLFYRENIELPFFEHFLKDRGRLTLPEAYVFQTGANRWCTFDRWPPRATRTRALHLRPAGRLTFEPPGAADQPYDEYVSDPDRPVPYTETITTDRPKPYMVADQRFVGRRPDVAVYQTDVLTDDLTLAGPIVADLWVSTSSTAADWIVKLIDVFPNDESATDDDVPLGGYQMLVRGEAIRGRFRNSYAHPEPFVPFAPTRVRFELLDLLHTFKRGHRIMVQVHSSWFPLLDRNPQTYVDNIFLADERDFVKATHRIHHSPEHPTHLSVGILQSGRE